MIKGIVRERPNRPDRLPMAHPPVRVQGAGVSFHPVGAGDDARLQAGRNSLMYDALYAWLCHVRGETRTCNPQKTAS